MSEIKVNSIKGVGASTAAISIDNSSGTCTANITNNLSNRNLIINGAMQVAQRGTSSTTSGFATIDRFKCAFSGHDEALTQAQVDVASGTTPYTLGFRKAFKITNGNQTSGFGNADYFQVKYTIEAQDIANSGWNYTSSSSNITLSFWIKSSVAQNFYGYLKSQDGTFKRYVFETGSLTADTWTKITKTISGNSDITFNNDTGEGLILELIYFAGSDETGSVSLNSWATFNGSLRTPANTATWWTTNDATLEITGVQLEVGSVATDFEHRSFAQELALCQRYYFHLVSGNDKLIGLGMNFGNPDFFAEVTFPVTMRAAPSLDITTGTNYYRMYQNNSSGDDMNSFVISRANTNKCNLYDSGSGGSAGKGGLLVTNNASASVAFSSEL